MDSASRSQAFASSANEITWENLRTLSLANQPNVTLAAQIQEIRANPPSPKLIGAARSFGRRLAKALGHEGFVAAAEASWEEAIDILADQIAKNRKFIAHAMPSDLEQLSPVLQQSRRLLPGLYHQLPCTRLTTMKRLEMIRSHASPNQPVLIVGDDDGVSIELVRSGFSDVTVIDIDEKIIGKLATLAVSQRLKLKAFVHDLTKKPGLDLIRNYQVVLMDPPCSSEGAKLFLHGTLQVLAMPAATSFIVVTNCLSQLPAGLRDFQKFLLQHAFEVVQIDPASSVYPIPMLAKLSFKILLQTLATITGHRKFLRQPGWCPDFFISDTLILRIQNPE